MALKIGRIKLVVTISTVFISLILVFGIIIRQYGYHNTTRIILDSSKALFFQVSQELLLAFHARQDVMKQSIGILSKTGVMEADTVAERMNYIPLFTTALNKSPYIAAIEIGYEDGDFFIVRQLTASDQLVTFNAPEKTRYVVDYISHNAANGSSLQRRWYNENLEKVKATAFSETDYDPRLRPWYIIAKNQGELVSTDPYFFHFFKATGITVSVKGPGGTGVIGGDVLLDSFSNILSHYAEGGSSEMVLLEKNGNTFSVVAHSEPDKLKINSELGGMVPVQNFPSEAIQQAIKSPDVFKDVWNFSLQGETWLGSTREIVFEGQKEYYLITVAKEKEMLAEALSLQSRAMHFTFAMLLITVLLTWLFARRVSLPILQLAEDTDRIRLFQFDSIPRRGSFIKEVDELENSISMMRLTISKFLTLITSLSSEKNYSSLLQKITEETLEISGADIACTFLFRESANMLVPGSVIAREGLDLDLSHLPPISLDSSTSQIVDIFAKGKRAVVPLNDILEQSEYRKTMERLGLEDAQNVIVPLKNRQQEPIGLLCFTYEQDHFGQDKKLDLGRMAFIEALSGFSAVTLEGREMLKMQKDLLESFIKLIAGAIDSKSPYTGGHCQRVPVLTKLLAQKACDVNDGAFKDFSLTEEQWEELHIASWLHDCGKVTTPEYVVDKSTKLETIYDRIHEIRTRFEVIKRDAHIQFYEKLLAGGDKEQLEAELKAQWAELDEEFAFVADCNLGGEFMAPEKVDRLKEIGARKWMRTISKHLGIGWEEARRMEPEVSLPVEETVLADLKEHVIRRTETGAYADDNPYGFKLDVPENLYNRGELYNLSVAKGTLTDEERFKINDHIVQTIIMLKQLPYPKHLSGVPDIAGGHHEKIDGTGYPRKINGDAMTVTAKMMVIADIFEALTASDRPYKKAKTLSESIRILGFMVKDNHIDKELFKLFLTSGAYMEYGKEYLRPEQLDEVDIEHYL